RWGRSTSIASGPFGERLLSKSFFAVEIISLCPFYDDFFPRIFCHCPFAAIGVITGIASCAAAARIIGDHVINKIFVTSVAQLMRLPRLKQKRVAGSNFGYSVFVAHIAAPRNDEIKL